ncbi:MAG TPA: outer membrane lipoprotein-sorting protein [Blastocatellia bacterium]|nr:outer membrane lipoprotein-sorting protein [Blastocatellia bacterium]
MNRAIDSQFTHDHSKAGRIARLALSCALMTFYGCDRNGGPDKRPADGGARPATSAAAAADATQILERNRALDNSRDSTMKLTARIQGAYGVPPEVAMTVYRKREADGRLLMLVEFTSPPQERDRSAIVTVTPQGEVEGTRYAQSGDTFVSTKGVLGEDSLFGMTLQELIDGQPEKYDFKVIREEAVGSAAVYRLEGALKQGAESKFNRLVMLVSKETSALLGAEFYDNHNELVRRLTVDKIEPVAGRPTRMHWLVDNAAKQKKIEFTTGDAKYDQNLSDSIFTREHLKKIATK